MHYGISRVFKLRGMIRTEHWTPGMSDMLQRAKRLRKTPRGYSYSAHLLQFSTLGHTPRSWQAEGCKSRMLLALGESWRIYKLLSRRLMNISHMLTRCTRMRDRSGSAPTQALLDAQD